MANVLRLAMVAGILALGSEVLNSALMVAGGIR